MTQIKWGLIGCGDISRKRVAPALRDLPNCDLAAVNRARFDLAEQFARDFGARKWLRDWRDLVADPEIQAMYIATPVHLHAEQTIAAAAAGKHVLCEKPMAMNAAECEAMIQACSENRVKCGVAYYRHFYPVIDRIAEIVLAGEIGTVSVVQINAFDYFNPPPDDPHYWFVTKAQAGGGPMMDFGCHRLEVLLNLFGPVTEVCALSGNVLFQREVEDTTIAVLRFASGPQAVLSVTHAAREPQDTLDIYGSDGSIHVQDLNTGGLTVTTAEGGREETHAPHANPHQLLIDDFTCAVLEDRDPGVGAAVGRDVAVIEDDIYGTPA